MSTFPALVPSSRTFTPGDVPNVKQVSLSGMTSGFRRGNRRIAQGLSLSFQQLTQQQLDLITAHYVNRQGSFNIFFLPQETWSGYAVVPVPSPSNVAWRYATSPTITDSSCNLWSVDIELTSYVIDLGDIIIELPGGGAGPSPEPGPSPPPPPPPVVDYIYDGLSAALLPVREYIIDSGESQ
jgi:hypothetical protein